MLLRRAVQWRVPGAGLVINSARSCAQPGDVLIPKKRPSAFFATPLASHLIDLQADALIVPGCTTRGCVRGSVVDAFAFNFPVLVAEDAVNDRSRVSHAVDLFDMSEKYAMATSCAGADSNSPTPATGPPNRPGPIPPPQPRASETLAPESAKLAPSSSAGPRIP